jgi:hypothetical protein
MKRQDHVDDAVLKVVRASSCLRPHARCEAPACLLGNRRIGSSGDFSIWHETFTVKAGQYEAVYNNMREFGLAKASERVPAAAGRQNTTKIRLQLIDGCDEPVYGAEPSLAVISTGLESIPSFHSTESRRRLKKPLAREVVA